MKKRKYGRDLTGASFDAAPAATLMPAAAAAAGVVAVAAAAAAAAACTAQAYKEGVTERRKR